MPTPLFFLQAISQSFHTVFVEGVPAMDMQVCRRGGGGQLQR